MLIMTNNCMIARLQYYRNNVATIIRLTVVLTALGVMTVISVGIGYAFKSVPDALKSSIPIGEILGVGLMVYFGRKRPSRYVTVDSADLVHTAVALHLAYSDSLDMFENDIKIWVFLAPA
jgi:hypothetical protein